MSEVFSLDKMKVAMFRSPENNFENPPTKEEMKDFLCGVVDKTFEDGKNAEEFYMVVPENFDEDPKIVCITGNGPTSKKHAYAISTLPDLIKICQDMIVLFSKSRISKVDKLNLLVRARYVLFKCTNS
jgi:hypothetical protein